MTTLLILFLLLYAISVSCGAIGLFAWAIRLEMENMAMERRLIDPPRPVQGSRPYLIQRDPPDAA